MYRLAISRGGGLYVIYTPRATGPRLCKSHRDQHMNIWDMSDIRVTYMASEATLFC